MYQRAQQLADIIKQHKTIHIVTHIDADGITSGSIAYKCLQREGKDVSIEFVKSLDEMVVKRLIKAKHPLIWFTDLGSSISTNTPQLTKIITDHHECPPDSDLEFHLNPHLFDKDGSYELSGAGAAYLVAKALNPEHNQDLSALAIVGACGDLQDRTHCKLVGVNQKILSDANSAGVITSKTDIRYFGRETRPISKLLQYSNDPILPGLTTRESACTAFLSELGIPLKDIESSWRRWIDLDHSERQLIISRLITLLLNKGFNSKIALRMIGEVYELTQEESGSELHDTKEFATLLNSTARYGEYEVGLNICLGDRGEWLKKGRSLLRGHRANLVEGLQYAKDCGITKQDYLQYYHAKDGIRDTIVGIVTNMLLNSDAADCSLPILGFAYAEDDNVKVSARSTQILVDRGLDLSRAMQQAAQHFEGVGGGHNIAAGATIPKGKEQDFIHTVEEIIKEQLQK